MQILAGGLLIAVIGMALWCALPVLPADDRHRIVFASLGVVALPLVAAIQTMLFRRFNSAELIQGRARHESMSLPEVFVSNTLEQVVLAVLAILVAGFLVPVHLLKLPLVGAVLFLIGRVVYYVGYARHPMNRFVGFVIRHYSSLGLLAVGLYYAAAGV